MGRYSSLASIEAMLDRNYTSSDIYEALNDLEAMYQAGYISEKQYKNFKILLKAKL